MKGLLGKLAGAARARLGQDSVRYKHLVLPPRRRRLCGWEFKDEEYFLTSAQQEADRLIGSFGATADSAILDVGCGVGRLAIGLVSRLGQARGYHGIDVSQDAIDWCKRHLARASPELTFTHIDVHNARYNPSRRGIDGSFRFPLADQSADIIYLYSVFSHMEADDVRVYLGELARLLRPAGKIFLTGFIEQGVPDVQVNPPNYHMEWRGALHCVRYDRAFFERLLAERGLRVERFEHAREANGQSGVYVGRD